MTQPRRIPSLGSLVLIASLLWHAACATPPPMPDYGRPLPPGAPALLELGPNETPPDLTATWAERADILPALERSIEWSGLQYAQQFFPIAGISHPRALESLLRFREILFESLSPQEFVERIDEEFTWYKSAGWDGLGGGVLFTGYFTPILDGRMERDAVYNFPLYDLPPDLVKGVDGTVLGQKSPEGIRPYPTRRAIEAGALLEGQGLELVWLRDPLDAFIAHVNGSAFVRVADGSLYKLGYSGKNGQPYTSLGGELIRAGEVRSEDMSLSQIRLWARSHPEQVNEYLLRNDSYVFFTPIEGNPRGSLNVEVSAERSLATDKSLFPRGALVFVDAENPVARKGKSRFQKLMLDQDTGGAIRTAGRADIYFGVGDEAEVIAGATRAEGQLYYLFLDRR
jgi:membrane-bound lytic murein transglycosylase A